MKFIKNYSVEKLSPADYNPRKINKKHFQKLKESILNFGIVKPIIVNRTNGSLTAGHQRIKALQELGITEVPVLMLENIAKSDEIKFNLFHNSIETNLSNVNVMGIDLLDFCFNFAEANCINFDKNLNPAIVKEIGKLIIKYGELGNVVCDETGKIICNSDYAITCKLLNKPLLIYKMENKKVVEFLKYISLDYGQYYFDTLGIKELQL